MRGVWGFAGSHPPHGDRLFQLGRRVPVLTIVIDSPERIAESFAVIDDLTREHGVVTSEMVPALTTITGHGPARRPSPRPTPLLIREGQFSRRPHASTTMSRITTSR